MNLKNIKKKIIKKKVVEKKEKTPLSRDEVEEKYATCKKFIIDDSINPFTGRKIKRDGPTYKKILRDCENYQQMHKVLKKTRNDKAVKNSLKRIDTSIRRVITGYSKNSPDLIIKRRTRRVKKDQLEAGSHLIELLMILYLMRKHKKNINFLVDNNFEKIIKKINTNKMIPGNELKYKNFSIFVSIHNKDKNEEVVYSAMPYEGKDIRKFFKNAKKSKARFTIMFLTIKYTDFDKNINKKTEEFKPKTWAHANAIIYDKKTNTAYRFEPNGQPALLDNEKLDKHLEKIFNNYDMKYENIVKFCPLVGKSKMGPQMMEQFTGDSIEFDPVGFCSYWSSYFIDFVLTNSAKPQYKNTTIGEFLDIMMKNITKKFGDYNQFIRTFGVFFNEIALNIGTGRDIGKVIDNVIKDM